MSNIKYSFETLQKEQAFFSNYILQVVKNRKLSNTYHSHDFFEIFIILKGSCVTILNHSQLNLTQGQAVLMYPGDTHSFLSQSNDLQLFCLSVRYEEFFNIANIFMQNQQDLLNNTKTPLLFTVPVSHIVIILNNFEFASSSYEYDCKLLLINILYLYLRKDFVTHTQIPYSLQQALDAMRNPKNLREGISALESLSGYSRSQLLRLFKRHYNMTPHKYILEQRLQVAYTQLISTDKPINVIAEDVGFYSTSHFIKIFKTRFLTSPTAIRKSQQRNTI